MRFRRLYAHRRRRRINKLHIIIGIVLLIEFIYASVYLISSEIDLKANAKLQEQLSNYVDGNKIDFKKLKEQNPDTIAHIKVNNTNIDYVVVKPTDNEFYLKHNFNKDKNRAGWIFTDYRNKVDESDRNLIIYGHNMRDNSMFETLKYVIKEDWYKNKDNREVTLITEKGIYTYKVFATYSITAEDYYINTDFKIDDDFNTFVNKLKSRSVYNYGVNVNGSDKILTLSSCLGDGRKRVVLHAKLVKKD